jgi:hypothetical protein
MIGITMDRMVLIAMVFEAWRIADFIEVKHALIEGSFVECYNHIKRN